MSTSLTFVVPTRNRAEYARAAVGALLRHPGDDLRVLVSDNSSDEGQAEQLARFCRATGDRRLTYLRSADLTMPAHWDWALEQALARGETSHYSIHYDRKIVKRGGVGSLLEVIAQEPEHVTTYLSDQVISVPGAHVVWQTPWTGRVHRFESAQVLRCAAAGLISEMGQGFPILSNCAIPGATLEQVRGRFGSICDSTGPDAAFTFRHCALHEEYRHLDRPIAVIYGSERSNGAGYLSGRQTDYTDFRAGWGDRPWLEAAPLPGLDLGWNMLFHEYELVRRAVGDRLPPLSPEGYLHGLSRGLAHVDDPARRAGLERVLEEHGWDGAGPAPPVARAAPRMHYVAWTALRRASARLLATAFGVDPVTANGFSFRTERAAVRFALRTSRRRVDRHPLLDTLTQSMKALPIA
ncbi:MAG: pglI 3 [Solirubrobacterales bacterium]|nr:pglI 3 [Solirubrobacterales bacterium]